MKKQLLNFGVAIAATLFFAGSAQAQLTAPVNEVTAPAIATATMAIDGTADEADWSAAVPVSELFASPTDFAGASDLSGEFKICWNYVGIYMYTKVNDDVAHIYASAGNDYQFDNIELFFNWDTTGSGTGTTTFGTDGIQMRFNRGYDTCHFGWGNGGSEKAAGYAVVPVDFKSTDNSTDWVTEILIPWLYILPSGTLPEDVHDSVDLHKATMGFDVSMADSDGTEPGTGARDAQLAWDADVAGADADEDNAWQNTAKFGLIHLSGTPISSITKVVANNFEVYPNPASNVVNFKNLENVSSIEFVNMVGQTVKVVDVTATNMAINVEDLATGAYFAKINASNGVTTVKIAVR